MTTNTWVWVLEREVFADGHATLVAVLEKLGIQHLDWNDEWWLSGRWPRLQFRRVVFHGSLENAAKVAAELPWRPGSFCDVTAFSCRAWYPQAAVWLVHPLWHITTAQVLLHEPVQSLRKIVADSRFFIRPDSPLKPFAGRVLTVDTLSLEALDYGFYHEDANIPVVITPVVAIAEEYRCVVVQQQVVTGCSYQAESRIGLDSPLPDDILRVAQQIASQLPPPQPVYVMDLCRTPDGIKLLELNPFGGADLYTCDRERIVRAILSCDVLV